MKKKIKTYLIVVIISGILIASNWEPIKAGAIDGWNGSYNNIY
jgi:hypothetical protein